MKSWKAISAVTLALAFGLTLPASAEKRDILGSFSDWDAIVVTRDSGERICYMISVPKATAPEGANRGNIYVTITHRPKRKVRDEVNIVVGYPFKAGVEANVAIGPSRFNLFTEGQGAWAYTPEDDAKLVAAMKAGSGMTVKGTSARGTNTTDQYSLSGFTAAYNAISRSCG
ncbi:MAG TPA: invasion associated locus B family protein [Sphingomonadales bacterium]|nr:invasion associated locus B family protein [Sphingomonadales bacterium]